MVRVAAGVAVAGAVGLVFALRSPSPVGHWNSAEGRGAFGAAYAKAMREMPRPAGTADVRTDFGFVRIHRFAGAAGRDAPLVLLPGRAAPAPIWADLMPHLLRIGDVYTIDLLGEPGHSVQETPISSEADQAAWLDQTLSRLPERTFHVVGLSLGGWTAANLALRAPGRVATLTLIEPVSTFAPIPLGTALRAIPASVSWLPRSWRDSFASYTAGGAPVRDVPVAEMIEAGMRHYTSRLPQPSQIAEEALGGLGMPVLAVFAGRSVMHDAEESRRIAERALPRGTVKVYPEATHAVTGERPEGVAADLAAFLDAV